MGLASFLASIEQLDDLPGLAAELGHCPQWDAAPEGAWALAGGARAALVGRAGELPWYAVEAAEPGRAARRLARRLVTSGRLAGVMALSRESRRLGISVAFADTPHLEFSLDEPDRLGLGCLERMYGAPEASALAIAARFADALAGEVIGRRFFREFRATLDRLADALPRRCPPEERHGLALLQLTRILFLYLVQSKGWLDQRIDFLARQVDRCLSRRRHLQRDLLRPLFFGTLNRPAAERSRLAREFGRVPFLNGGLFEPHPLERRWRATLPNELWRGVFDELFERFRFDADESGRAGAIAPDMLGRVFEGVMEPQARRQTGTFYTPAALVRQIVRAGLTACLAERLRCAESKAERALDGRSPAAQRALRGITILDPAVGSGAFLLGALDLLASLTAGDRPAWQERRRVLGRSLFGVDLNPAAVRLAELRLWLAVITDDPADAPEQVRPLPNLDCLIRQGDSLIDPLGGSVAVPSGPARPTAEALARLRRELVNAVGDDKRASARELRQVETRAFAAALDAAEAGIDARIRSCLAAAREHTLFGDRRGLDAELRRELGALRREQHGLRSARRRFVRSGELPWFHYQSHFADVFARGGFDLVVGNPPWVRAERLAPEYRAQLAARYRWWRSGVSRGFANRPDLALAFLERSWELLRPGGTLALLVPAKLASAAYGVHARHALAGRATLRAIADLTGRPDAAFDATVYPLALVATKHPPARGHRVRTALAVREAATVPQAALAGGGPWVLVRRGGSHMPRELGSHPTFGERLTCHLGVKTGANEVFLDPAAPIEPELLRWALRGRDVRPFGTTPCVQLLWPCDDAGRPLTALPPLGRRYLAAHRARLRARADFDGGPEWALFRTGPSAQPFRVVWADLARRLTAAPLVGAAGRAQIPLNTCYVAAVADAETAHRVAAWLNSTWIRAAARLVAPPASGGFARFGAAVVAGLPLPDSALLDPALGQLARDAGAGRHVQPDLDAAVAGHLGLDSRSCAALRAVVGVRTDDRR